MSAENFRLLIESGHIQNLRRALALNPDLANQAITWFLNQENDSDPLHYVCDCVFNKKLSEDLAREVAALLLEHGARVEGSDGRESPLIGATSLGVETVATLLIEADANLEATAVFGARPLHWAAAIGLPNIVATLIQQGADRRRGRRGRTTKYASICSQKTLDVRFSSLRFDFRPSFHVLRRARLFAPQVR